MAEVSGTIGTKRDLRVRLGATLTPLFVTLQLGSGEPIAPDGTSLVACLYAREADTTPLADPVFDVTPMPPSDEGAARYLIELSREKVAELVALPAPPAIGKSTASTGARVFWWACFFEDSGGARVPVYYGKLTIMLGAASA
jgi:hypothetical protein